MIYDKYLSMALTAMIALGGVAMGQTPVLSDPNLTIQSVVTSQQQGASGLANPIDLVFVSDNDILVLQRSNGQVRRVVNGQLQAGHVLDLPIASGGEQGALSICLSPDFANDKFVYIFYVYSGNPTNDTETGSQFRVSRFFWNGNILTNESILFSTPRLGSYHVGGIIAIGPPTVPPNQQKLFIALGDQNVQSQAINMASAAAPANVGVILRRNLDGSVPSGTEKGPFYDIAGANVSLQSMYSYGSRNIFGMTFDHVTGHLWTTENGQDIYDEVNRVIPGGNGGWIKHMGPAERADSQNTYPGIPSPANFVTFGGVGTYYDPVFSWRKPNAVTGLGFINSDKYGSNYKDKLLVTSYNAWGATDENGKVFIFTPNSDTGQANHRTQLVLAGTLQDKVHDLPVGSNGTVTDSDQSIVFGKNMGGTTNVKTGPDGYIYIASMNRSTIYKVLPTLTNVESWDLY